MLLRLSACKRTSLKLFQDDRVTSLRPLHCWQEIRLVKDRLRQAERRLSLVEWEVAGGCLDGDGSFDVVLWVLNSMQTNQYQCHN